MGIETADDCLRNELLKRHMSRDQIIQACRTTREAGINLITTNTLGLPTGSLETDFATLELNSACRPGYANASAYQSYPRTSLGEFTQRQGLIEGSFDDISTSAWDRSRRIYGLRRTEQGPQGSWLAPRSIQSPQQDFRSSNLTYQR